MKPEKLISRHLREKVFSHSGKSGPSLRPAGFRKLFWRWSRVFQASSRQVVPGKQNCMKKLTILAVKLYTMVISTLSTYYIDATKPPLPCEGEGRVRGGFFGSPYPPSPCPLPPTGGEGKTL
jgi:hypothetical protein